MTTPPNPKRPPRSPRSQGDAGSRQEPEVELPFDDDEVAPLRADDPRPQHVPQFPAGRRSRPRKGSGGGSREGRDKEMPARFGSGEYEDPGHSPAFLYVERGPGTGQLIPVKQGVLVLGRASSSDLRLQHPSISRRHAQLTRRGDRLYLKDLNSQNGTFVNRSRLANEVEIFSGDELALGNALLKVRGPGPLPESPRKQAGKTGSSLRVGMSARRLMLLAGAAGSLVAVFLTLTAIRLVRSRSEPPRAAPRIEESESPATEAPVAVAPEEPEEDAPGIEQPTTVEETVTAEPPLAAKPTPAPVPKVRSGTVHAPVSAQRIAEGGKGAPSKPRETLVRAKVTGKTSATEPRTAAPADPQAEAEALHRYEEGHVDQALAVAKRAHLDTLAATLNDFQREWMAGNTALAARDMPSAILHLSTALELDQRLSKGWSTYGPRIQKALTQAHMHADTRPGNER